MRLAFTTLCCPTWSFETIVARAAEYGFEGVDLRGIGPDLDHTLSPALTTNLRPSVELLNHYRLQVPCLCTSLKLISGDETWAESLGEFLANVELASKLPGSRFIRVFPGPIDAGVTDDQAMEVGRRHAGELAELTRPGSVIPVLETHDSCVTAVAVNRVLGDLPADRFGVLWDVRHSVVSGEPPEQTLDLLGPRLAHLHFKDSLIANDIETPTLIGEGQLPLPRILSLLRRIGYGGWISLENEKRWRRNAPDPEVILPQFARFMVETGAGGGAGSDAYV